MQTNDLPIYLFRQGTNFESYRFFGAHPAEKGKQKGYRFRVWADNAAQISVIGSFNDWNPAAAPMECERGIWEVFIPGVKKYDKYKYRILSKQGEVLEKADPFAFHSGWGVETESRIFDINGYEWHDRNWCDFRKKTNPYRSPMNIYEVHAGSWRRYADGNPFSYRKLAEELIPYAREMGYTHIELLPITEHPLEESWGYQCCGYFAPTSRFGTPHDFMYFVDECHRQGLGVILDWVPSHYPKDAHGLYRFDGDFQYDYKDPAKREQPQWGTAVFDYGRPEVQSFLISSALYWLKEYHVDGLRVDAVTSMLYLSFGKEFELRNAEGGEENKEAVAFLQKLNQAVQDNVPDAIMIAEESTSWQKVTKNPDQGGLGFHFKWNMGWMNDILDYIELDPFFRKDHHNYLTFSFMYAFSENYVLPISHDEVVHGKKSLLDKIPGPYENKFAGFRAFLSYMYTHPGKKLLFMGSEYGPFREWDYENELEWFMLDYEPHRKLKEFTRALNLFYLAHPALWEEDCSPEGFQWISPDDNRNNVVVFQRKCKEEELVIAVNFAPQRWENYRFGLPEAGNYDEIFSSDDPAFGGNGIRNGGLTAEPVPMHGKEFSVAVTLPPLGTIVLKHRPAEETPRIDPPKKPSVKKVSQKPRTTPRPRASKNNQ
ncbi:MAG: 1,4-alpha-glucan branching protein GlgB [Clostridia bacterium]|nr:1,4-alpha-glucan branching protein GlgB [Clostridia bacterium]